MRLVSLTPDYPLTGFDCGDDDLNRFLHLTKKDEDEHTRLMYFDMMEIAE